MIFSGPDDTQSLLILFASEDGGKTWKPNGRVAIGDGSNEWPFTVADSTLITVSPPVHNKPRLTMVSAGGRIATKGTEIPASSNVDHLSFATRDRGWVSADGKLLSTDDGGATWIDVTPRSGGVAQSSGDVRQSQRSSSIDTALTRAVCEPLNQRKILRTYWQRIVASSDD